MSSRIRFFVFVAFLASCVSTSVAENYAILFCGGDELDVNWLRYYNTTNWMHEVLVEKCNYLPENIYVLAAYGLDSAEDRQQGNWPGFGTANSDWTDITDTGTTVQSATQANLVSAIASAGMTSRDTFLWWSFDHGSGDSNTGHTDEESLAGWGEDITALEFPTLIDAVAAERQAFVFAQCYAGGMLDELDMTAGRHRYGCAATNHYESAKWYPGGNPAGFAHAYFDGLDAYYTETHELFDYAVTNAPNCFEGNNDGTTGPVRQNPWDTGLILILPFPTGSGIRIAIGTIPSTGARVSFPNRREWSGSMLHVPVC